MHAQMINATELSEIIKYHNSGVAVTRTARQMLVNNLMSQKMTYCSQMYLRFQFLKNCDCL